MAERKNINGSVIIKTDPTVIITARTLPVKNYSTKILEHNGFELIGTVMDEEDGAVWEWKYKLNELES